MNAILQDTFLLTIIIIVASTLIIATIRRVHIDRCLKGYEDDMVRIFLHDGTKIAGKLDAASTGLELLYQINDADETNGQMSYILYKEEYSKIALLVRYYGDMNDKNLKRRNRAMIRAYHPGPWQRFMRHIGNFFKTIKDAIMEIFTQLSGKLKSVGDTGAVYAGQEKYAKQLNKELVDIMDSEYNPILEKYIGNVVVVDAKMGDKIQKLTGVLKDYTSQYIEIWDVDLPMDNDHRRCDILVPTAFGRVRHVGEMVEQFNLMDLSFDIRRYKKTVRSLTRRGTLKRRQDNGRLENPVDDRQNAG